MLFKMKFTNKVAAYCQTTSILQMNHQNYTYDENPPAQNRRKVYLWDDKIISVVFR